MSRPERDYTEILPLLRAYVAQRGYGPSLREVAEMLGCDSTSYASKVLQRLEADGFITRTQVNGRYLSRLIEINEELVDGC